MRNEYLLHDVHILVTKCATEKKIVFIKLKFFATDEMFREYLHFITSTSLLKKTLTF